MPKWLQAWLGLYLGIFTAGVIYFGAVAAVAHGEPSFTREQKAQLAEDYPGGQFIDEHTYKWCAGQQWWAIDPRGNQNFIGGSCVRWR